MGKGRKRTNKNEVAGSEVGEDVSIEGGEEKGKVFLAVFEEIEIAIVPGRNHRGRRAERERRRDKERRR
jgi:hypothetical protein